MASISSGLMEQAENVHWPGPGKGRLDEERVRGAKETGHRKARKNGQLVVLKQEFDGFHEEEEETKDGHVSLRETPPTWEESERKIERSERNIRKSDVIPDCETLETKDGSSLVNNTKAPTPDLGESAKISRQHQKGALKPLVQQKVRLQNMYGGSLEHKYTFGASEEIPEGSIVMGEPEYDDKQVIEDTLIRTVANESKSNDTIVTREMGTHLEESHIRTMASESKNIDARLTREMNASEHQTVTMISLPTREKSSNIIEETTSIDKGGVLEHRNEVLRLKERIALLEASEIDSKEKICCLEIKMGIAREHVEKLKEVIASKEQIISLQDTENETLEATISYLESKFCERERKHDEEATAQRTEMEKTDVLLELALDREAVLTRSKRQLESEVELIYKAMADRSYVFKPEAVSEGTKRVGPVRTSPEPCADNGSDCKLESVHKRDYLVQRQSEQKPKSERKLERMASVPRSPKSQTGRRKRKTRLEYYFGEEAALAGISSLYQGGIQGEDETKVAHFDIVIIGMFIVLCALWLYV